MRLHKRLSNKRPGSKNLVKARLKLAAQYSKVSNQRRDFNHKLSARLVRDHDLIAFEDLRIRNLMRNRSLAKSIKDASWSQLVEFTGYKAMRAARMLVKVPPKFSTQECPGSVESAIRSRWTFGSSHVEAAGRFLTEI